MFVLRRNRKLSNLYRKNFRMRAGGVSVNDRWARVVPPGRPRFCKWLFYKELGLCCESCIDVSQRETWRDNETCGHERVAKWLGKTR